jgi:hypothetical protein
LLDLWRGRLSWRRLGVLLAGLPPESATVTAIRDASPEPVEPVDPPDGHGPWSRTEMLLALLADQLVRLQWLYVSAHTKNPPPQPEPLPRPGIRPSARREVSRAALAYFEQIRERHRRQTGARP